MNGCPGPVAHRVERYMSADLTLSTVCDVYYSECEMTDVCFDYGRVKSYSRIGDLSVSVCESTEAVCARHRARELVKISVGFSHAAIWPRAGAASKTRARPSAWSCSPSHGSRVVRPHCEAQDYSRSRCSRVWGTARQRVWATAASALSRVAIMVVGLVTRIS